jgi:hypothetical protein
MKELKRFQVMRRIELEGAEKKQTTHSKAIPKAFGFEAATRSNPPSLREAAIAMLAKKKCNLKKQTQFMLDEIGAKSFMKGDYDKTSAAGDEENKANRSQIRTDRWFDGPVEGKVAPASAEHLTGLRASQ